MNTNLTVATYQRCSRCIMDTSDPEITFDADGVCSHCSRFDAHIRDSVEKAMAGRLTPRFDAMVEEIKRAGTGRSYDCVVGVSGGVDSTYVLLKAVEAGLRPLAVHFDSGWNSELAVNNIQNATSTLGVDLKTEVAPWKEMRDLQLSFFKAGVANCDIPTDHAFPAVALRNAEKYGARRILSGSNLATESILPRAWGHNAADLRYLKGIQRRHGSVRLKEYPTLGIMRKEIWYRYLRQVHTLRPLNYLPYDKADAKREIAEKLQWRDYGGKHYESVFTRYFQGYYLPKRFGFDKRLAHLSSLILSGQMTRDAALAEVTDQPPYPDEQRRRDGVFIAKKLGISHEELERLIQRPVADIASYPSNDRVYEVAFKARKVVFGR